MTEPIGGGGEPRPRLDLSAAECRVLGSLIEKERATPQNYPLTINALRLACNQSTNRDPVVDYDIDTVEAAVSSLRERGFARVVYSPSNRAAKYRHVLDERLGVNEAELAVLGVLLVRGPQTVGEIKGRSERLHSFGDLGEVQATLDDLAERDEAPLVLRLERRPGQKDARHVHLLAADEPEPRHHVESLSTSFEPSAGAAAAAPPPPSGTSSPINPSPRVDAPPPSDARRQFRTSETSAAAEPVDRIAPRVPGSSGVPDADEFAEPHHPGAPAAPGTDHAAADLFSEIRILRDELAALRAEFETFRSAFE